MPEQPNPSASASPPPASKPNPVAIETACFDAEEAITDHVETLKRLAMREAERAAALEAENAALRSVALAASAVVDNLLPGGCITNESIRESLAARAAVAAARASGVLPPSEKHPPRGVEAWDEDQGRWVPAVP